MHILRALGLTGCLFLALISPAHALNILVADDYFDGLDSDMYLLPDLLPEHKVTHLLNIDFESGAPVLTRDLDRLKQYDVVIFYASGDDGLGRSLWQDEKKTLEAYIAQGGHLICTGYDILAGPESDGMANLVRSSAVGDETRIISWTAASINHFILNGPHGDMRGRQLGVSTSDHDGLKADVSRGGLSLGTLDNSSSDKIVFTWLGAGHGSVGAWNGNDGGDDWIPDQYSDGPFALAILRNWLAGLADQDHDGYPAFADECPDNKNRYQQGQSGCLDEDPNRPECEGAACICRSDTDQDNVNDCNDACPFDPAKTEPGLCGCGKREPGVSDKGSCSPGSRGGSDLIDLLSELRPLRFGQNEIIAAWRARLRAALLSFGGRGIDAKAFYFAQQTRRRARRLSYATRPQEFQVLKHIVGIALKRLVARVKEV